MRRMILPVGGPGSGFPGGAEDGGDEGFIKPTTGEVMQFGDDGGDGIEKTGILGEKEAAEQAGGLQPEAARGTAAEAFIHQERVGMKLQGEGEGLPGSRWAAVTRGG